MPEKELIIYSVYPPAASADLAIRELMEFHQLTLIVVLIGAVATVLFAILYWLLKKWIRSKSA